MIVRDLATQWLQACPCKTKTSQETEHRVQVVRLNQRGAEMALHSPQHLGDLITADHKVRKLSNESRCGHRDAPSGQAECTKMDSKLSDGDKGNIGICVLFTKSSSARQNFHGQWRRDRHCVSRSKIESWRDCTSSLRIERSGRKSRPQSERSCCNRSCSKRSTGRVVGLCDGVLLSLSESAGDRMADGQTAFENRFGKQKSMDQ